MDADPGDTVLGALDLAGVQARPNLDPQGRVASMIAWASSSIVGTHASTWIPGVIPVKCG
jgi:hypothetical protein